MIPWGQVLDGQFQLHTCRCPVIPNDVLSLNARTAKTVLEGTGDPRPVESLVCFRGPGSLLEAILAVAMFDGECRTLPVLVH